MQLIRLVIGRAAQVLMLGKVERALREVRFQVESILEDGLHALPAHGAVHEGTGASRFKARHAILLAQGKHAKAATEGLLWVAPLVQQPLYQYRAAWPHGGSPRSEHVSIPASHFAMCGGHVRINRGVPAFEGAVGMAGDALATLEQLDGGFSHTHIDFSTCVLAGTE